MSSPRSIPPRPILKSSTVYSAGSPSSPSPPPTARSASFSVQFSPSLSTTYLTHGSADYNRSCIVVSPNDCRIPPRGCPGRNYTLQPDQATQWSMDDDTYGTPGLVADDGSSSEDSDSIPQPSSPTFPSYIPASIIAKSRTSKPKRSPNPTPNSSSCGFTAGYSIPRPTAANSRNGDLTVVTGRDESWGCLGGF